MVSVACADSANSTGVITAISELSNFPDISFPWSAQGPQPQTPVERADRFIGSICLVLGWPRRTLRIRGQSILRRWRNSNAIHVDMLRKRQEIEGIHHG